MEELLNLSLSQIFGSAAGIALVVSIFVEIAPIKVNPISALLKWMGKRINSDLMKRMDDMELRITKLESIDDERNAINCRIRILRFGDEIRRGLNHSEENFDQVLADIDEYEHYCDAHPNFKNNKTITTKEKILKTYAEKLDTDDFL